MSRLTSSPGGPLSGIATVPGDKSCSHRALIIAALAEGESRISNLGEGEDVLRTVAALRAFGVNVQRAADGIWQVNGGQWQSPDQPIDCGNSGTTARLLIGAVAGMEGVRATFFGDGSLSRRPMKRLVGPLQRMGAMIEGGETLPITIEGAILGGIDHRNVPASGQVKTAILLAGVGSRGPVRIDEPVASRDHGEIMLGQFGCAIDLVEGAVVLGDKRRLLACDIAIAADPSAAAFPLVGAATTPGSSVTVEGMLVNPTRTGLVEALEEMGARVSLANERIEAGEIVADVTVGHGRMQGISIAANRIPSMIDEIPALAVAAAMADGETLIEGLSELRVKESDRLGAILAGLVGCGVTALADGESLRIFGRERARGGTVASHGDHRIAMAFLTLGLGADGPVMVDDCDCIATSFPDFVDTMNKLGAGIE